MHDKIINLEKRSQGPPTTEIAKQLSLLRYQKDFQLFLYIDSNSLLKHNIKVETYKEFFGSIGKKFVTIYKWKNHK